MLLKLGGTNTLAYLSRALVSKLVISSTLDKFPGLQVKC